MEKKRIGVAVKMVLTMAWLIGLCGYSFATEEETVMVHYDFHKDLAEGISLLENMPQGEAERKSIDGLDAVKIVPALNPDSKYLFFEIDREIKTKWTKKMKKGLAVLVTYYDYPFGMHNNFWIEYYDGKRIKKTRPKFMTGTRLGGARQRTPLWRKTIFILRNLVPDSDKLNGADFRISVNNFLAVTNISVIPLSNIFEEHLARRDRLLNCLRTNHLKMLLRLARANFMVRRARYAAYVYPEIPASADVPGMERDLKKIYKNYDKFISKYDYYFFQSQVDLFKGNLAILNEMYADLHSRLDVLSRQINKLYNRTLDFQNSLQNSLKDKKGWKPRERVVLGPLPDEENKRFRFGDGFYYGAWEGWNYSPTAEFAEYARMLGIDIVFLSGGHTVEEDGRSTASRWEIPIASYWRELGIYTELVFGAHHWLYGGFPGWLREKYGNELYAVGGDGEQSLGRFGAVEVSHPAVLDYLDRYTASLGQTLKHSQLAFYRTAWEPHYTTIGHAQAGFGKIAEAAFRKYLQEKYKTIENLNMVWGSHYENFDAIKPPPSVESVIRRQSTPLVYEWEKWRRDAFTEYHQRFNDGLRQADPGGWTFHASFFIYGGLIRQALDHFRQGPTADIWSIHGTEWADQYNRYLYSLNRYFNRILAEGERMLGHPDYVAGAPPDEIRRAVELSIMEAAFWGKRYITHWLRGVALGHGEGPKRGEFDDKLFNDYIASLPLVKERVNLYGNILLHTDVSDVETGILLPYSSNFNAWPNQVIQYEIIRLSEWLTEANYNYFIVPEQALIDGKESLDEFKVLIVPYSPLLDPKASEIICRWVEAGGTLITSGPLGVMDPLGRPAGHILKKSFGEFVARYYADEISLKHRVKENLEDPIWRELHLPPSKKLTGWHWNLSFTELNPDAKILLSLENGAPVLMEAPLGKGRIITSTVSLTCNYFRKFVLNKVAQAIPARPVIAIPNPDVSVHIRRADSGQMYVFAFNNNIRERWQGTIAIKGHYQKVVDLSMPGGGMPLPVQHDPSGYTLVDIIIDAGDWAVLTAEFPTEERIITSEPSLLLKLKDEAVNYVRHADSIKLNKNTVDGALRQTLVSIANRLLLQGQYQRAKKIASVALRERKVTTPTKRAAAISVKAHGAKEEISIDGHLSEWSDIPFQNLSGDSLSLQDIVQSGFAIQWDSDNIYLAIKVFDDNVLFDDNPSLGVHWRHVYDGVRLFFGALDKAESLTTISQATRYGDGDIGIALCTTGRRWVYSPIGTTMGELDIVTKRDETGYTMEIAIPLKDLHLFPVSGLEVRFQLHLVDNGSEKMWSKEAVNPRYHLSSDGWGRLIFSD